MTNKLTLSDRSTVFSGGGEELVGETTGLWSNGKGVSLIKLLFVSFLLSVSFVTSELLTSSKVMSTKGLELGYVKKGLVVHLVSERSWLTKGLVETELSTEATESDIKGVGDRAGGIDGEMTRCSSLPASPQEKCVTVTGVGDLPSFIAFSSGSWFLLESEPLRDRVNLSPP